MDSRLISIRPQIDETCLLCSLDFLADPENLEIFLLGALVLVHADDYSFTRVE